MKGEEGFNNHYLEVFNERWEVLKDSLLKEASKAKLNNPFIKEFSGQLIETGQDRWDPPQIKDSLKEYYLLDFASFKAAECLDVKEGERVLDMCSAPGGKALSLFFLSRGKIELICNELSADRRGRLKRNLREYLPEELVEKVTVKGYDASKWGMYEKNAYDKILLDAPCSSEEHVIRSPDHLKKWSLKRTKGLAIRQGALILSAFDALKSGGTLIYATCALSPLENDKVVAKLLKKKGEAVEVCTVEGLEGDQLEFGVHVLPDKTGNGPLYVAKIKKRS